MIEGLAVHGGGAEAKQRVDDQGRVFLRMPRFASGVYYYVVEGSMVLASECAR